MEYGVENLDWSGNAGQQLDTLARTLPPQPRFLITVFGSAPLQLMVERSFLSEDIDVYSAEEHSDFLTRFVEDNGWAKGQRDHSTSTGPRANRLRPRRSHTQIAPSKSKAAGFKSLTQTFESLIRKFVIKRYLTIV